MHFRFLKCYLCLRYGIVWPNVFLNVCCTLSFRSSLVCVRVSPCPCSSPSRLHCYLIVSACQPGAGDWAVRCSVLTKSQAGRHSVPGSWGGVTFKVFLSLPSSSFGHSTYSHLSPRIRGLVFIPLFFPSCSWIYQPCKGVFIACSWAAGSTFVLSEIWGNRIQALSHVFPAATDSPLPQAMPSRMLSQDFY